MNTEVMFSSKTDLWETPQFFFDGLDNEFHFTLDACALPENAKCERFTSVEVHEAKMEAYRALEKQCPKKPIGKHTDYKCSVCGRRVRSGKGSSSHTRDNYCQRCVGWRCIERKKNQSSGMDGATRTTRNFPLTTQLSQAQAVRLGQKRKTGIK